MIKDTKRAKLEFRLTAAEKQLIVDYAAKRGISISEAIRYICEQFFNGSKKD